ncbi:hypothetical protein [Lysinibacillus sp. BW-2-10]|uniref:hypothetical protein n=1 Tax=Lysinibacillus sp. BW-2-10 TaxID=2590030 RepID=UPI00117F88AC|nr:hypothetical protein [Lysinibacillus sp. BW-2-10]TSI06011.1 hypothetical protein FJQ64_11420 [Lysinibacillus sp. BW-2-10]
MYSHKQVALSLERQHSRHVKHYYRAITDVNLELAKIHKQIEFNINKELYKHVTDYVNQYISYTTIWNIKFVYNLESPEVLLMQLFHLEYIFMHEPANAFIKERRILNEQKERFNQLKPYTKEHVQLRRQKMLHFINEYEKNPTKH